MVATIKHVKDQITPNSDVPNLAMQLPNFDEKIAELAYYKAESRGFEPGHEVEDWLEAEQEFIFNG